MRAFGNVDISSSLHVSFSGLSKGNNKWEYKGLRTNNELSKVNQFETENRSDIGLHKDRILDFVIYH